MERLSDEELRMLMKLDGPSAWMLQVSSVVQDLAVRAVDELRERRAADLSAEELPHLRFLRKVVSVGALGDPALEHLAATIAVLDRLLEPGK